MTVDYTGILDEREQRLVKNCVDYARGDPAGLPGHNLVVIIAKLHNMLENLPDKYLRGLILDAVDNYSQEWNGNWEDLQLDLKQLVDFLDVIPRR